MNILIAIDDTQNTFSSVKEAIKYLKTLEEPKVKKDRTPTATFNYICGYEGLRDGTHTDKVKGLIELKDYLNENSISFDEELEDFYHIIDSIQEKWSERWDDGGGSGWIDT